jgi:hypothetical protein
MQLFFTEMIAPNMLLSLGEIEPLSKYSPHRYSLHNSGTLDLGASTDVHATKTTEQLERATRWWLSFADSLGREVTPNNEVSPLKDIVKAFELSNVGRMLAFLNCDALA